MWYALLNNDDIIAIQKFNITPTIFDFKCYFSSSNTYHIRKIQDIKLCD